MTFFHIGVDNVLLMCCWWVLITSLKSQTGEFQYESNFYIASSIGRLSYTIFDLKYENSYFCFWVDLIIGTTTSVFGVLASNLVIDHFHIDNCPFYASLNHVSMLINSWFRAFCFDFTFLSALIIFSKELLHPILFSIISYD